MAERSAWKTCDANEAVAHVAYRASEVIAIYPITPSSTMGELSDEWATAGKENIWGAVPRVVEMQSEGGAAGAVHGALQAGALTTTFTASQGLLLMIPNLYKIAGELTSCAIHVAARSLATHALSIFGDHSDVMACRQTGVAMLCSSNGQEAHDMAAVAHGATLKARIPFIHFFDGFRTSHELTRIQMLTDEDIGALVDLKGRDEHRQRGLTPDHPVLRGTAQNPDAFFQCREASNGFFDACPGHVKKAFEVLAARTGRSYKLFDYHGHPAAENVVVIMGSGVGAVQETVDWLVARGERVGVLKVRLYRPFSVPDFVSALPESVRTLTVLDRTKEPGAVGDPLHVDVIAALNQALSEGSSPLAAMPRVLAGRYGLSSKEFDPGMVRAIFDNMKEERPRRQFTVGIVDDVGGKSLPWDRSFDLEPDDVVRAVFYGLGSDGTVGANKNSIKIIGEGTDLFVQGYFVYDSKKSGAITVSHLRFGPRPIQSSYLVKGARFVACHQFGFLERYDVLERAAVGATFLLSSSYGPDQIWDRLPADVQRTILERELKLYVIDAEEVARTTGFPGRINTIMQTCFFALSGVLPFEDAISRIKKSIEDSYGKRGPSVVAANIAAVDVALAHLHKVQIPTEVTATFSRRPPVPGVAPEFVRRVQGMLLAGQGDLLPVSAFPVDGTWPTATARWEKRNLASTIPVWDSHICIQCNKCALACPHAAIRPKVYEQASLAGAPATFKHTLYRAAEASPRAAKIPGEAPVPTTHQGLSGLEYTLQVAPEDCTGCGVCVEVCPAKDRANPRNRAIMMEPQESLRDSEAANFGFFLEIPDRDPTTLPVDVRGSQLRSPLFEFSGACSGCGETPYIKLLTQLFGDRLLVANATGCSSIYGGNLPTTPYTTDREGRGPAWSNSLFEDAAEFGLGFRLAIEAHVTTARHLVTRLAPKLGGVLVDELMRPLAGSDVEVARARKAVATLRTRLSVLQDPLADQLAGICDYLVKKSVWVIGGDGWAYDIGFGGVDHVLSQTHDVNLLVLDTQVYSNTGGQQSKATPMGAVAKFATAGKSVGRKDLGLAAIGYGHAYVASVAFGAKDQHAVKALLEAEAHSGPSLVVAYSHCIAHGYDMVHGPQQQKRAVDAGAWPLYRFDPIRSAKGESPLVLDSGLAKLPLSEYMKEEARFRMLERSDPPRFRMLADAASVEARRRHEFYQQLATILTPHAPTKA